MHFQELNKKQADLQDKALEILKSIPELEKSGASEEEIEAKIAEANRHIAESSRLGDQMKKGAWLRTFEMKVALLIGSLILIGAITFLASNIIRGLIK